MPSIRANDLRRTDVLNLNGALYNVAQVTVDDGMVKVAQDIWGRSTPIYFKADQYVDVNRHPRFDLADLPEHRINPKTDPVDFIDWLESRGWKIVPK